MLARSRGPARTVVSLLNQLQSGFSRTFWVANILELFERFAYYGSKAVLAVYIAFQRRIQDGLAVGALK